MTWADTVHTVEKKGVSMTRKRIRDRSTGEILVLMVAATVCGYVIVSGTVIILLVFVRPEVDTTNAARNIGDVINTLIGLMAGFLAGRTDVMVKRSQGAQQDREEP